MVSAGLEESKIFFLFIYIQVHNIKAKSEGKMVEQ